MNCTGGCHCGRVRFSAIVDTANATHKCNCSYCSKTRFWKVFAGAGDFRITSGEDALKEYRFGNDMAGHFFCGHCGVNLFMRVDLGEARHGHVLNLACLDEAPHARLAAAPVVFEDGRNDNWWVAPEEVGDL